MGVILFNGVPSSKYGIQVEHPPKYTYPERDYTIYNIPGSNKQYVLDNGLYKPVTRSYDISFPTPSEKYSEYTSGVLDWLHSGSGYCRLEDSYDPEIYRMAYYKEEGTFENIYSSAGRATINFVCRPERFLKSGEKEITANDLLNTNKNTSKPIQFPYHPVIFITLYKYDQTSSKIVDYTGNFYMYYRSAGKTETFGISMSNMSSATRLVVDCENRKIYTTGDNKSHSLKVIYGDYPKIWGRDLSMTDGNVLDDNNVPTWSLQSTETIGGSVNFIPRWWIL